MMHPLQVIFPLAGKSSDEMAPSVTIPSSRTGCDPRMEWLKLKSLPSPAFALYPFL